MTALQTVREAQTAFEEHLWQMLDDRVEVLLPVYMPLVEGRMSRKALAHWAGQMYVENVPVTRMLGGILANCDDLEAQEYLIENLWEESGEGRPDRNHLKILKRFVVACGVAPAAVEATEPDPETRSLLDYYLSMREWPWVEAVAAFGLGIEGTFLSRPGSELPSSAVFMAQILRDSYGFAEADLEFFLLHNEADITHTRKALEIVRRLAPSEDDQRRVEARIRETIERVTEWARSIMTTAVSFD
jgi:pyrroloquinoline-quinone synthase